MFRSLTFYNPTLRYTCPQLVTGLCEEFPGFHDVSCLVVGCTSGVDSGGHQARWFRGHLTLGLLTGGSYLTNYMAAAGEGWGFKAKELIHMHTHVLVLCF